jgi:hypothetical protein
MKRIILLLFTGILVSQFVPAQVVFNFGPELGLGISSLPKSSNNTAATVTSDQDKTNPFIGPLVGLYGQMIINKILLFNTGLQYEISGQRFTENETGINAPNNPYTVTVEQHQTFQKLCIPLSVGVTFPLFKVHLSIFGGWRGNSFLTGKYYYNSVSAPTGKPSSTTTFDYNPVSLVNTNNTEGFSSFNNQVFFGISVSKNRLEFAFYSYIGLNINYSDNTLINAAGAEYKNNDFVLAVRYRFYGFRSHKVKCNIFA